MRCTRRQLESTDWVYTRDVDGTRYVWARRGKKYRDGACLKYPGEPWVVTYGVQTVAAGTLRTAWAIYRMLLSQGSD